MTKNIGLFLFRLSTHLCVFACSLTLQFVGAVVLLPLLVFYNIGELPRALRWFDSADPFVGRDTTVISLINRQGYLAKYHWLAWRNPINYFGYKILGFQFKGDETYEIKGYVNVGDSTDDVDGYKQIELSNGKYEYLYVKKLSPTTCFYFRLGHKIGDRNNPPGSWCQEVFTLSYRSYSGQ